MGNQLVKKSQNDSFLGFHCKILILGSQSSGKTTLFHEIVSQFPEEKTKKFQLALRKCYLEEFLSNLLEITIKVGKICTEKKKNFHSPHVETYLSYIFNNQLEWTGEKLNEIKSYFPVIWKEKAMQEAFEKSEYFDDYKNFVSESVLERIEIESQNRIGHFLFLPMDEEITSCRKKSSFGVKRIQFQTTRSNYEVTDARTEYLTNLTSWKQDMLKTDLIVYLFSGKETVEQKKKMEEVLKEKTFKNVPILFLHNKKDINKKMDISHFTSNLKSDFKELECCLIDKNSLRWVLDLIKEMTRKPIRNTRKISKSKSSDVVKFEKEKETPIVVLFLGSGEVGKSTMFKQIKKFADDYFTEKEIQVLRNTICANILVAMKKILKVLKDDKDWNSSIYDEAQVKLMNYVQDLEMMDLLKAEDFYSADIKNLLKFMMKNDEKVKEIVKYNHKHLIKDGISYWMDNLDETYDWTDANRSVIHQNILSVSTVTLGLVCLQVRYKGKLFDIYDTGGQRSERRKWVNIFDKADAIVYVSALSQYNEVCFEDERTNKMVESLNLVRDLGYTKSLTNVPFYLYLNKQDVLMKELGKDPISIAFPNCPKELKIQQNPKILESLLLKDVISQSTDELKKTMSWIELKRAGSFDKSKKSCNSRKTLNDLSDDELSYIFGFLQYKKVVEISVVNSAFYDASNNDYLWKAACLSYDPALKESQILDAYDSTSHFSPWKHYFYEGKRFYLKVRDYIVNQFVDSFNDEFNEDVREFRSIYTTSAVDDQFLKVFQNTLDDILSIPKRRSLH
eukprot:gene9856-2179_t